MTLQCMADTLSTVTARAFVCMCVFFVISLLKNLGHLEGMVPNLDLSLVVLLNSLLYSPYAVAAIKSTQMPGLTRALEAKVESFVMALGTGSVCHSKGAVCLAVAHGRNEPNSFLPLLPRTVRNASSWNHPSVSAFMLPLPIPLTWHRIERREHAWVS